MQSPDHPELAFVQAKGYTAGRPDGPPLWIVVHDMEAGESSTRAESTAAYFANPSDGRSVSSHYCVDDNSVVQCVRLADSAWTVGNRPGNNRGINWELSGYARQTRAEWLDAFGLAMFRQMRPYVQADAARFGIPLVRRTVAELQAFKPGITSHNDLRLAFGGTTHTDPGAAFPWDVFMAIITGEDDMALTDRDAEYLVWRIEALLADRATYAGGPQSGKPVPAVVRAQANSAKLDAVLAELAAQRAVIEQLAEALKAGGGSVDMAAIDERLAALRAQVEADTRDAVADLAEGGATQVRAD
ncbi:MAG TPA: peptidoglycan recognition family protein [Micromonosporaceae bacterium]